MKLLKDCYIPSLRSPALFLWHVKVMKQFSIKNPRKETKNVIIKLQLFQRKLVFPLVRMVNKMNLSPDITSTKRTIVLKVPVILNLNPRKSIQLLIWSQQNTLIHPTIENECRLNMQNKKLSCYLTVNPKTSTAMHWSHLKT